MFSDRIIRKMEQRARGERAERLAAIQLMDWVEEEDDEVVIVDPETNGSVHLHISYGRVDN